MKIALIAHDAKKKKMVDFTIAYESILMDHELFATGTTGKKIMEATDLSVTCFQSGPLGGDQEIGAMVAKNEMDIVLFFRDPLTAQPHEVDISALMRLCDVYDIPLATNLASAEIMINGLKRGDLNWREIIHEQRGE
ncbi:MAG TPA: methylglyoxal synthase [Massilibacterium sp.]|nr:methylglyoxal synthase [Massilibacterium sp.]